MSRITALHYVLQDQRAATRESYEVGVKGADPLAPSQVDPTNDLVRVGPLSTPPSTLSSPVAWIFTATLATPFDGVPTREPMWVFVDLPSAPNWTTDGLTVHESRWAGTAIPTDTPNSRATTIPLVHTVDQTAIRGGTAPRLAVQSSVAHLVRLGFVTPGSTLRVGSDVDPSLQVCPNPNYGAGGIYPDHGPARRDGLALRFEDANTDGSAVTVLATFGGATSRPPIPMSTVVNGGVGSVYLSMPPLDIAFAVGRTGPPGILETIVFPWPLITPGPVGFMSFQAFVLDRNTGRLRASNLVAFDSQ